jgi:hypothetical protein
MRLMTLDIPEYLTLRQQVRVLWGRKWTFKYSLEELTASLFKIPIYVAASLILRIMSDSAMHMLTNFSNCHVRY